jgi:hypothetical protein
LRYLTALVDRRGFGALLVDLATVADLHDDNNEDVVVDLEDDAVVALPNAIPVLVGEFLHARYTWILGKLVEAAENPSDVLLRNGAEILRDRIAKAETISCHGP